MVNDAIVFFGETHTYIIILMSEGVYSKRVGRWASKGVATEGCSKLPRQSGNMILDVMTIHYFFVFSQHFLILPASPCVLLFSFHSLLSSIRNKAQEK